MKRRNPQPVIGTGLVPAIARKLLDLLLERHASEQVGKQIAKVRRGVARLIDAYEEGLLQKDEFEPRIKEARQRLSRQRALHPSCCTQIADILPRNRYPI
jgi:hypothetical protein